MGIEIFDIIYIREIIYIEKLIRVHGGCLGSWRRRRT